MSEAPAPVFLGGCPRSGLTLLRALLSTHPGIYCGSDTVLAPPIVMQWKSFSTSLGQLHSTDFALDSEAVRQNMATCEQEGPQSVSQRSSALKARDGATYASPTASFACRYVL